MNNKVEKLLDSDARFGHYLVRLGKPVWLMGYVFSCSIEECSHTRDLILETLNKLNRDNDDISSTKPIPFAIPILKDARCNFFIGFAGKSWIVDVITWLQTSNLPNKIYDSIMGLLCGYDLESIQKFIDNRT